MNKTVTINLNGCVFVLDDDAYRVLRGYIEELERHFANEDGRQEIVADIEARIAEHFKSGIRVKDQVIGLAEVNRVIGLMGRPGQLDDDVDARSQKSEKRTFSRMYRDLDDKILGGVCSGMGYYLKIEPLLFRVIFIVSLFWGGLGAIMYVILWVVVPPAETKAQKLEMRGKPVTAENIGKDFDSNNK